MSERLNLQAWTCQIRRGEMEQATFGFGHDFRRFRICVVERGSGREICEISADKGLSPREAELCARVIRQAPLTTKALQEAARRLGAARHPNAVALRQMIQAALSGLDEPLTDEPEHRLRDI